MFNSKQKKSLLETEKKETSAINQFIQAGLKTSAEAVSGNGAKKYSTTGNAFVDQFGKLGSYKQPRSFQEIATDCELLWAINPRLTVVFMFYIRMITRVVTLFSGVSTSVSQKGAELKHEGITRMIWLHVKAPNTFWKNISLFISIGSWKDIFKMLSYDLQYNGWKNRVLDWDKFGELILSGLENKNTSELVKKYLPTIRATSKAITLEAQANTIMGKWICSLLFDVKSNTNPGNTYKRYRKLKSSGTAHEWQQLISKKQFDRIDFGKVHGRALSLLVRSKFLTNQGLKDRYEAWVSKPETEVKYTGFVHELFSVCSKYRNLVSMPIYEQTTINKQFQTLVEKGGEQKQTSLIVVRDTSSSMGSSATGTNMSCYDVAKALALYFSEFLSGSFQNNWIEFNNRATMKTWTGNTPLEKWYNDKSNYVGSTNFQSVIDLFVSLFKQGIPESDFPTGILCISDSEFNPTELGKTNVEVALNKLKKAGFSEEYVNNFVIVLWNLQNTYYGRGSGEKFETFGNVPNVFYFSGYSAATVSFLTSKIKNAEELFLNAMDQDVLNLIEL